jgi:hypothetical protein
LLQSEWYGARVLTIYVPDLTTITEVRGEHRVDSAVFPVRLDVTGGIGASLQIPGGALVLDVTGDKGGATRCWASIAPGLLQRTDQGEYTVIVAGATITPNIPQFSRSVLISCLSGGLAVPVIAAGTSIEQAIPATGVVTLTGGAVNSTVSLLWRVYR